MKQLFVITTIIVSIWGCSPGNQNSNESPSISIEAENIDTAAQSADVQADAVQTEGNPLLDSLRFGMSEEEVIALLGEPTNKETVGKDPNLPAEDWWYGENQKVRMINHTVNHVVKDVAHQKELLQQLMVAKKNNDEAEVKRIMDELTEGHK